MASFTKRVDASIRQLSDRYNTHWAGDGWVANENYGQVGNTTEFEDMGTWYGGIKNLSMRFTGVTIPQGATITSATISLTDNTSGHAAVMHFKITGVDEDNTAEFTTSPIATARTRTHTTAVVDWDPSFTSSSGTERASADISTIIQEIVDRGGWSSGNAIGIYLYDDGTSNNYWDIYYYSSNSAKVALLTITYEYGGSASVSPSASGSPSVSPSASVSPSSSASVSQSASASASASPSPMPPANPAVLKIAKDGVNVLTNSDIEKLKFSSEYGTLKYFTKQAINISFDASTLDISAKGEYAHNLGYYPFVEVYVSVYIGSPTGIYEYCPFFGSGATVAYNANAKVTTDKIFVYGEINGVSASVWHFDFLVFIYKNNLFP